MSLLSHSAQHTGSHHSSLGLPHRRRYMIDGARLSAQGGKRDEGDAADALDGEIGERRSTSTRVLAMIDSLSIAMIMRNFWAGGPM